MLRAGRSRVWFLAACVLYPCVTSADTFAITSGTALVKDFGPGLSLSGSFEAKDFSLDLSRWNFITGVPCVTANCDPGQVIALDTRASASIINVPPADNAAVGSATVRGQTYSNIAFGGDLAFSGPSVSLPPLPSSNPQDFPVDINVGGPFTFTGTLRGYRVLDVRDPVLLFTANLTGRGRVSATLLGDPGANYSLLDMRYDFAPVPEPASLFLVGSGLMAALVGVRVRSRRAGPRPLDGASRQTEEAR